VLTLVLTRHGSTPRSEPEQHLGQKIDIELSEAGREAARALGRRLDGVELDRIVSSPLRRALETARIVAGDRPTEVEVEPRLAEMDYGEWEGLTYEQIYADFGPVRTLWETDPASLACPGGESGNDVANRVRSWLEETIESTEGPDDRQVLAVAHSTTNRVLLCVCLGVPIRDYRRRFRQEPANLSVLRMPGPRGSGGMLLLGNDVAHIRGLEGRTWG
jgi:broad specificity phosphatase PhoE